MSDELEKAKNDPRLPATTRLMAWCQLEGTNRAPKCDAAAHELHIPRSTAADAIRVLVTCGVMHRAA